MKSRCVCTLLVLFMAAVPAALAETPDGAFRVFLSSANPTGDWSGPVDLGFATVDATAEADGTVTVISKLGVRDEVDLESPENSLLLEKTVFGGDLHGGGTFWKKNSPDYLAIRQWITEGAMID